MNIIQLLLEKFRNIQLDESTGGLSRRWIEVKGGKDIPFIHSTTKEVFRIIGLSFLPADPGYKFEDNPKQGSGPERLDLAIQRIVDKVVPPPTKVEVFGQKKGRAAMVVVMQDEAGDSYVFVKKVIAKNNLGENAIFWQTTDFARMTGLYAQTAQMKKAVLPIEPTDFISVDTKYDFELLIPAVIAGIENSNVPLELKEGLPILLTNVKDGNITPVPGLAQFQPAIEVKLSELAAPLALRSGNLVTGNYDQVNKGLLEPLGYTWATATSVSFPPKAEKLIDATIWFGDEKIGISVKDGSGGARPSTATIAEVLDKGGFSKAFLSTYKLEIAAIRSLDSMSAIEGPLTMAVELGALNTKDVDFLKSIYGKAIKSVPKLPKNLTDLLKTVPYQPDATHPEYQLGYHLLAVVAKYIANEMNSDPAKMTKFFKGVLNKSSLVQVYSKTKIDKAGGLYYSQFNVVWPPVFEGVIEVDADSYTARTRPSRKVSFSFNSAKAKKETGSSLASTAAQKALPKPDIRPTAAKVARKKVGFEKTTANLGRNRR